MESEREDWFYMERTTILPPNRLITKASVCINEVVYKTKKGKKFDLNFETNLVEAPRGFCETLINIFLVHFLDLGTLIRSTRKMSISATIYFD